MLDKILKKSPWWVTLIAVIASLTFVVFFGGKTETELTTKAGCVYEIEVDILKGVMDAIDDCKAVNEGDVCDLAISAKVTLKTACEKEEEVEPEVTTEETAPEVEASDI